MNNIIQILKQHFLPGHCVLCQQKADISTAICDQCVRLLPLNLNCCRRCANPLTGLAGDKDALHCGRCLQHPPYYNQAISPFIYQQRLIYLMHRFKYHNKLYLGRTLSELFISRLKSEQWSKASFNQAANTDDSLLIPVPLHQSKLKQRGFNQSAELCRFYAQKLALPVVYDAAYRVKITLSQRGLKADERQKNMINAFTAVKEKIAGKHIIIVDDVMTTGATVNELAKTVKQAGARHIDVWTIARA